MKIGDRVNTPNGIGAIVSFERYTIYEDRVGVELDKNPFKYSPCFYHIKQCKLITKKTKK